MTLNWAPVQGRFSFSEHEILFKGKEETVDGRPASSLGLAICSKRFSGGEIAATVDFKAISDLSACDIVFWYHPNLKSFVNAGLSTEYLYGIRHFATKWFIDAYAGEANSLEAGRPYHLRLRYRGSRASLAVDGVEVVDTTFPFSLAPSQVGLWCRGTTEIAIRDFSVKGELPRAFIVMAFESPYDELHHEVLKVVCDEFGLEAVRADDVYGPGLIIADVARHIQEAKVVIAEITPRNPNVFYELGYAHALGKPTILLAERASHKELPFDVSPFRTLFYDNTIEGKGKVEEGLRRHIRAVLEQTALA